MSRPNQEFSSWRRAGRVVVAAVCYRFRPDAKVEFLLVRTRAGRWTFPKGAVDRDPSVAAAAAREAYEEAGVSGRVQRSRLFRYVHGSSRRGTHLVRAHLCEVLHAVPAPEIHRDPTWFSVDKANQRLREHRAARLAEELERVVDAAVYHLFSLRRVDRCGAH